VTRAAPPRPAPGPLDVAAPLLAGEGISVRFGGLQALSDVSIEVPRQAIVGLIGPNGAGKSTLIGVLSGLLAPSSGRVSLGGVDVTSESAQARARRGLARTFQQPELFAGLSIREHLMLAWRVRHDRARIWQDLLLGRAWQRPRRDENERVDQLLESLGLARLGHAPVAALPLGYSRLVEIGRALAASPKVVLLDEPLSGLDGQESEQVAEILYGLVGSEGVSFLLVDHDVDTVLERSARVMVLDFGEVITVGTAAEVRSNELVRAAYLGDSVGSDKEPGHA
jgi:branched-chain amino acid transport system ATP-binding protein